MFDVHCSNGVEIDLLTVDGDVLADHDRLPLEEADELRPHDLLQGDG